MITFSRVARAARLALVPLALAALAACTNSFDANVSRFAAQLPPAQGQTIAVVADDPRLAGGLEFGEYAGMVSDHLAKLGYVPVENPKDAALVARFSYGVDKGREKVRSTGLYDPFYRPTYTYQPVVYSTSKGPRVVYVAVPSYDYGWNDPFGGRDVYSYTVFASGIELKIDRTSDGQRVFEGRAEASSNSNRLQYLVPKLIDALFTGFPGNSGETVRVSLPLDGKPAKVVAK